MNPADVLILGVPHTGNHFMLALLPGAKQQHPWPNPTKSGEWLGLLDEAAAVICPMRHPLLVAKSWKQRGKDITDELEQFWRAQVDVIDRCGKVHYLCLDLPDVRGWQLELINSDLDLELDPGDWPVLRDHRILPPTELTQGEREYVCLHHWAAAESFFDRWYA